MLSYSVSENLRRNDLSDYEKALSFQRLRTEFGKTFQEIAQLVGYSESHVCNYVRMLKLFDESVIESNPLLKSELIRNNGTPRKDYSHRRQFARQNEPSAIGGN